MAAASADHDALDGSLAHQAGLAFAPVHAVLELEESLFAVGIDVVGDGRTTERDRFLQYLFHRQEQFPQMFLRDRRRTPTRPNTGAEQGLVGINVSDASQQFLVEKSTLDWGLAPVEQFPEAVEFDFERLKATRIEISGLRNA
jgi:hypothetical protein